MFVENDNEFLDLEYENGQVQKIAENEFIDLEYNSGKVQKISAYNESAKYMSKSPKVSKMEEIEEELNNLK